MAFDTSDPNYLELLSRVLQSSARVVPVVGPALSAYGHARQRRPLHESLIAEGIRLGVIPDAGDPSIDAAVQAGRYAEAMDRLAETLGVPTFNRVIQREIDQSDRATPPAIADL